MEYGFEGRFGAFSASLDALAEARRRDPSDSFVLSGTSAKFSITFELAWKLMKDILIDYYAVSDFVAGSPRETLRAAFRLGLIDDDRWMDMLKLRSQLAHDYNLETITAAFTTIVNDYIPLFEQLRTRVRDLQDAADAER